jgi:hypothetical protein
MQDGAEVSASSRRDVSDATYQTRHVDMERRSLVIHGVLATRFHRSYSYLTKRSIVRKNTIYRTPRSPSALFSHSQALLYPVVNGRLSSNHSSVANLPNADAPRKSSDRSARILMLTEKFGLCPATS